MVKCSKLLQCSDVLLVLSFLSLFIRLYVLYIFVSFCKLCILIVMFMYYCYVCSVVSMNVGPCHHGMARPRVADGGTASNMEGSCE